MHVEHSQFVGAAVIAIGCVRRHLFMAERNEFDTNLVARVDQSVIRMSALSEDLRDPFLLQALCNERRSVHFCFSFEFGSPVKAHSLRCRIAAIR
jgi:hypothetical protein